MEWENELKIGANFLNENLFEITNDGVSLRTHEWGALKSYTSSQMQHQDYHEAYYVLQGKGSYIQDRHIGNIRSGTLILTSTNTKYQFISNHGLDMIHIGFELKNTSHAFIQKIFHSIKKNKLYILHNKERSASVLLWISLLKLAAQDNTIYLKNNIDSLAITLFWSVLKDFEKNMLTTPSEQMRSPSSTLIYRAKIFIIEHLSHAITLKDVATHLHISERHLSRLFSQELGQPFTTFIRKERIRKAGILLSDSDIPIKEIAEQTGFFSVHYFTNVFSKEMDMPPGKFRKKFR